MDISYILTSLDEEPSFERYRKKKPAKKNGRSSYQIVNKPNEEMKVVHAELIRIIEGRIGSQGNSFPNAIAFIKGLKPEAYLSKLVYQRFIFKMDLSHAYSSVKVGVLAEILKKLFPSWGNISQIKTFLCKYCCNEKIGLFYGAPSSPLLFNLYCEEVIDCKIRNLLKNNKWDYWYLRYADDLIVSSREEKIDPYFRQCVRQIFKEAQFLENHWKTKYVDRKQGSVIILGRQLGCMATVIKLGNRTFSTAYKYKKLKHSVDRTFGGLPRRVVGMPSKLSVHKSLETLERDMYRASCGAKVKNPRSLVGRMIWFVQSVYPSIRQLSRTERKLVKHFLKWAIKNEIDTGFIKKLNY